MTIEMLSLEILKSNILRFYDFNTISKGVHDELFEKRSMIYALENRMRYFVYLLILLP